MGSTRGRGIAAAYLRAYECASLMLTDHDVVPSPPWHAAEPGLQQRLGASALVSIAPAVCSAGCPARGCCVRLLRHKRRVSSLPTNCFEGSSAHPFTHAGFSLLQVCRTTVGTAVRATPPIGRQSRQRQRGNAATVMRGAGCVRCCLPPESARPGRPASCSATQPIGRPLATHIFFFECLCSTPPMNRSAAQLPPVSSHKQPGLLQTTCSDLMLEPTCGPLPSFTSQPFLAASCPCSACPHTHPIHLSYLSSIRCW